MPSCFIGGQFWAPRWLVLNDKIKTGYRVRYNSSKLVLRSLLQWHNDLFNVWSHLLAALLTMTLTFFVDRWREETTVPEGSVIPLCKLHALFNGCK